MTRQEANEEILHRLSGYIHDNPGIRFCQALFNLRIVEDSSDDYTTWEDEYYTESSETLRRVKGE